MKKLFQKCKYLKEAFTLKMGKFAISAAILAICDKGEEIFISAPFFPYATLYALKMGLQ